MVLSHSIGQDSLGALSPLSSVKHSVRHGVSYTQATETCFFVCTVSSHTSQAGPIFTPQLKLTVGL